MSRSRNKSKALPRHERVFPQVPLVFSTIANPDSLLNYSEKCFVSLSDYRKLEKKYLSLFERYKKTIRTK